MTMNEGLHADTKGSRHHRPRWIRRRANRAIVFLVGGSLWLFLTRIPLQNTHINVETKHKSIPGTNVSSSSKSGIFGSFPQNQSAGSNSTQLEASNGTGNNTASPLDVSDTSSSSSVDESSSSSNQTNENDTFANSTTTPESSSEPTNVTKKQSFTSTLSMEPSPKDYRPSGLRLVFMGDSITRYQYVSLVYFLRYGHWFNESKFDPHLVAEGTYGSYRNFYIQSTALLAPYERCDCFRPPMNFIKKLHIATENRYFWEPTRDNAVAFLTLFGSSRQYHGSFGPADAFHDFNKTPFIYTRYKPHEFLWNFQEWQEVVDKHVAQLDPKMTHVVLNAGAWKNDFASNPEAREKLMDSIHRANMTSIWKTTTYGIKPPHNSKPYQDSPVADPLMCGLTDGCQNLSWTRDIYSNYSWDGLHFYEPICRIFNEELLEMIGHPWPEDYKRVDRNRYINESTPHYY